MNKKNSVSLVIVSCSAYEDVLQALFTKLDEINFFKISFNKKVLASDYENKNNSFVLSKMDDLVYAANWGERVRNALKEIETEYTLVLLDDYIPTDELSFSKFNAALEIKHNYDCIYLSSVFSDLVGIDIDFLEGFVEVPDNFLYRVNSTIGLWRTNSLLDVLSDDDSPWEWEAFAGLSSRGSVMRFAAPKDELSQVYFYSYKTGGAVYRGSWVKSAIIDSGFELSYITSLSSRHIIDALGSSKRSLKWKLNFLNRGYSMVGLRVFNFVYYSYLKKLRKRLVK